MSYAVTGYYDEPVAPLEESGRELIFVPRSKTQWIPLLGPLLVCGVSYMAGGIPAMTDLGFLMFTALCGYYLTLEFVRFPRRFGIGGMVLWGGVLCWFCQDYFTHWFHHDYNTRSDYGFDYPAWVITKAAFYHVCFVTLMAIALNWRLGGYGEKVLLLVPDPGDPRFYLWVLLALFAVGLSPYFIFNAEPWYLCLYHAVFAGFTGGPQLSVYRTGNLNYSWGAYVAQIMQVGAVGGIIAIIYTILIAPTLITRLIGLFIWSFYTMLAFETGRRGEISFTLLPPIAVLFIKYQARAAMMFKKFSARAYVTCGLLTLCLLIIVQFQGTFRGVGYTNADLSTLDITKNQGNTMFSEGLLAYQVIPEKVPFFYAQHFPGEGAIVALPYTAFDFVVGMIPRALWHDKPVDQLWAWYNKAYTGIGNGVEGTTISHGLVGSWFFKFGFGGMVEGALLCGYLMGVAERALQNSEGKPINILMSLGFATWLFRTYRDFIFIDLYGLVLGALTLCILIPLMRPLLGAKPREG